MPNPFLTASESFSSISVWVMNRPRRIFEKKDFPFIADRLFSRGMENGKREKEE
jgi:hypothetical protein